MDYAVPAFDNPPRSRSHVFDVVASVAGLFGLLSYHVVQSILL